MTNWIIFAGTSVTIERADTSEEARKKLLASLPSHQRHKPWLADRWTVRPATEEEVRRYAAFADAKRPAEPTLKTTKRGGPTKTIDRLL
jgi:hypothetical protein